MRTLAAFFGYCSLACAQWVMASLNNAVAPDVHSVNADERFVYVESAGISLHSFGALEANQYDPPSGPRTLRFRLPREPRKAQVPPSTPLGIVGVFVTGVPIYNFIGTNSYRNQNLWHQDAVRATQAALPAAGMRSSLVGFALDGFPIRAVAGMRSSYRLRTITKRTQSPDGTLLTPAQEGPDVGPNFPLGYFAEDYEYAPGSGDLDESNGAVVDGAYSYFMTPTWPYLVGPRYYGDAPLDFPARISVLHSDRVDLCADALQFEANRPVRMTLAFRNAQGRPVRFLEQVHEKPVHLIVVSKDLAEFDHIHPEPVPGDALSVTHTFARAGDYWIYADYTAPGEPPSVARFGVHVGGAAGPPVPLTSDAGVKVKFEAPLQIEANRDVPLSFTLTDAKTGQPIRDLEPWLGAWGHIMIVSEDGKQFIHAHPLEGTAATDPLAPHTHAAPVLGPSPSTIRTQIGFELSGSYRLWFQFQRNGEISTFPFDLKVSAGGPQQPAVPAPSDAIPVTVSKAGFTPARVEIPAGRPARLAFTRTDAQNCGSEVVFPSLGLRKALPVGQTVVIDLPAKESGQFSFACGMGMYKGAVVVR
jgi:hypothetical protein